LFSILAGTPFLLHRQKKGAFVLPDTKKKSRFWGRPSQKVPPVPRFKRKVKRLVKKDGKISKFSVTLINFF